MLTVQLLEKAGYKYFRDSTKPSPLCFNDPYKGTWQKRFDDEKGKKYFINIEMWHFADSDFADRYKGVAPSFTSNTQFRSEEQTFNIELFHEESRTLEQIEAWFENVWKTVANSAYYELR